LGTDSWFTDARFKNERVYINSDGPKQQASIAKLPKGITYSLALIRRYWPISADFLRCPLFNGRNSLSKPVKLLKMQNKKDATI